MRRAAAVLLLAVSCAAQNPYKDEWRVLPAYQPKPNRVMKFMKRHLVAEIAMSGITAGAMYAWKSRKECSHYPPGENGVGVPCPKEYKWNSGGSSK